MKSYPHVGNSLTEVVPQLLAQGLMALRENAIMPRLVNRGFDRLAGDKGSTIDIPIPSAITAQPVTAANTPPSTASVSPTSVSLTMDQWVEAPFYLSDKELQEVMSGTIPMQASEAVKAIANNVDNYLLALYTGIYGYTGTAGTSPFSSATTSDATAVRKILNNQLAPLGDRRVVFDPDAEANALDLRAFQDGSYSGSFEALTEGNLNRKLGFDWFMNQNVTTHTAGTASVSGVTVTCIDANVVGDTTVTLDVATSTATLVAGDIISFAGHDQTYAVSTAVTLDETGVAVTITPGLTTAVDGSGAAVAVTVKESHVVNLAFHRDAIAFANRPLSENNADQLGSVIQSAVDPVSGLVLRLEVSREHKRTRYSYDILYGAQLVRAQLAARLAG